MIDLVTEIPNLKTVLLSSDNNVKKAFVLGVIDGRGTPDISISKGIIRYLSLDCPNDDIGDFCTKHSKALDYYAIIILQETA